MADIPKFEDTEELDISVPSFDDTESVDFEDTVEVDETPSISKTESLLRGAGQGITSGFQDEASAGLEGILSKVDQYVGGRIAALGQGNIKEAILGKSDEDMEALKQATDVDYSKRLEDQRKANLEAQQANPLTYGAGVIGGSVAQAAVPGAASTKVAGLATQGALAGAGFSEDDTLEGKLQDAATGALVGTAVGKGLQAAGRGIKSLIPGRGQAAKIAAKAEDVAFESINPSFKKQVQANVSGSGKKIGRNLLDENIVSPLKSATKTAEDIIKTKNVYGKMIGDSLNELDSAVSKLDNVLQDSGKVNTQKIYNEIQEELGDFLTNPDLKNQIPRLQQIAEKIEKPGQMSLKKANELVGELDAMSRWGKQNASPFEKEIRKIRSIVNKNVDNTAETAAKLTNKGEVFKKFQSASQKYGPLKDAEKLMGSPGSSDTITGLIKRQVQDRIKPAQAKTLDFLAKKSAAAPESLGKYGNMINKAAQRGESSLAATHYLLSSRDPQYREMYNNLEEEDDVGN